MENGKKKEPKILEGHYDRIESIEVARKALLGRKHLSMRFLMYLCFSLVFLIALGTAVTLIITNAQVEKKLRFLEITNDFTLEISQARRFEKNFFLYGTNLSDAMENIYHAKNILDQNRDELKKILGKDKHERIISSIVSNINDYQNLLNRLIKKDEFPYHVALGLSFLGQKEKALEWLELAYEQRDPNLVYIKCHYEFIDLRSEPRFLAILEKMNLGDYE